MKPMAIIASVVGVALVGSVVASPFVVGQGVEATLQKAQEGLSAAIKNQPTLAEVLQLKGSTYQRSPFNATQELTFSVGCPGAKQETIVVRNSVEHGPLPGWSGLGLAKVRSEVVLDTATEAEISKAFGGQQPYMLSSVGFDGRMNAEIVVPSGQKDRSNWSEVRATMSFSPSNTQAPITWNIGDVALSNDRETLLLAGAAGSFSGKTNTSYPAVGVGEAKMQFDRLEIRGNTTFLLKDVRISGGNSIAGSDMTVGQNWQVKKATVEQESFTDLSMKLNIAKLDAKIYNEAMQTLGKTNQSICNPDPAAASAAAIALVWQLAGLLQNPPTLVIEDLSLTAPDGRFKMRGDLEFTAGLNPLMALADSSSIVRSMKANANIQISAALLRRAVLASGASSFSFDQSVKDGYINDNAGELSTEIRLENGITTLNGKKL
jgi:uncharacterized protein YdgA (DUF945 family)